MPRLVPPVFPESRRILDGTAGASRSRVSYPRRIVIGETYLVTRRCAQRAFRLRPCAETNDIFLYCLAFAARRTGVRVHAACVMSNHHHLVVTDVRGVLPVFLRELHRLTAKAMNALQGQWENLWSAQPCNAVRLVTDEDIEDKIAYVVANPVAAGLVNAAEDWPGVLLWGEQTLQVARPRAYFAEYGTCPQTLALRIERPTAREGTAPNWDDWRGRISKSLQTKVAEASRRVAVAGRAFLGRAGVVASSFAQRARAYEARFGVIPTFAAKSEAVRERLGRIERYFRVRYRRALARWRSGPRDDALFPLGTWGMAVFHGARVDASGSDG
jgi:REP element-mobilizing transposase RayT